jgi:hypothetical protein
MAGIFSMPLSLVKIAIQGYVRNGVAPLVRLLGLELARGAFGFFFPTFLGLVSHLLQAGALKWSHETACEQYLVPSVHRASCNWEL